MSPLPQNSSNRAWAVVAMLWPVAVLNYLDRQMLATMGLSIKVDIPELQSAERFGQLMAIFLWVYACCSPLGGVIADRLNRKWLITASLGLWSLVTLLMGQVSDFQHLYYLRAVMGVSEAFYMPAGLALIADYHPGPTRSRAVGVHMSGVYMGQALGGVGGWVAQAFSWRTALTSCGIIGIAYCLVLVVFLREKRSLDAGDAGSTRRDEETSSVNWPGYSILVLCFTLPSLPGWAVKNWLPTLLQDRFAMPQAPSGLWATLTNASAASCGVLLGGGLADRWAKYTERGRSYAGGLGLLLTAPALAGMGLAPGFPIAIGCAVLFGLGFGIFDANNMPILCQLAPPRFRATGYGLMNFVGISAGALLTPLLGKLKDSGVPLATGFAYCALPALLAAVFMFLLRPKPCEPGAAPAGTPAAPVSKASPSAQ
ncbi:MAG TPA: MFS transporter [Candidatus Acidoferrum sp.]|jgi:ACS family D-galactonate transporter-like MFS transporter|nr:MFS transporter [Candidatus Acidoferrum sp.]